MNVLDLPALATRLASVRDNALTAGLAVRIAEIEALVREPVDVVVREDRVGASTCVAIVAWEWRVAPWRRGSWWRRCRRWRCRCNIGGILCVFDALIQMNALDLPTFAARLAGDR